MLDSANELGFRRSVSVTLRACILQGMRLEVRQSVDQEYQDRALLWTRLKLSGLYAARSDEGCFVIILKQASDRGGSEGTCSRACWACPTEQDEPYLSLYRMRIPCGIVNTSIPPY